MGQNLFSDMVNLNKAPKPVLEKQSSERRVLAQNSFQEEVKKEEHEANLKKRFFNLQIWQDFYEHINKFEVKDIPIDNLEDDKEQILRNDILRIPMFAQSEEEEKEELVGPGQIDI